jgi:hypothetical protein
MTVAVGLKPTATVSPSLREADTFDGCKKLRCAQCGGSWEKNLERKHCGCLNPWHVWK